MPRIKILALLPAVSFLCCAAQTDVVTKIGDVAEVLPGVGIVLRTPTVRSKAIHYERNGLESVGGFLGPVGPIAFKSTNWSTIFIRNYPTEPFPFGRIECRVKRAGKIDWKGRQIPSYDYEVSASSAVVIQTKEINDSDTETDSEQTVDIAHRLRRDGSGWILHERDREQLSTTFTNAQGKVWANPNAWKITPDGLVVQAQGGESSQLWLKWDKLPPEVREKYQEITAIVEPSLNFRPAEVKANSRAENPESLLSQAEFALRENQFSQAAGFLNRIVSEYPTSRQRTTVNKTCSILRDKENNKSGPVTSDEAQRLRKLMDNFETIKRGYWKSTPQTQRDLETVFGAEMFLRNDNSLDALASGEMNLKASMDKARQGQ